MTAVAGLKPIERLPCSNSGAKRKRIEKLLAAFMDSGASLAEVTVDSDGTELRQERIEAVRGYMYRIASEDGLPVGVLVRKDPDTGKRRMYLQRKESL